MITAEKNRRRGKTNSVKASIDEHIEWLEHQLKEIESQIQQAIAVNDNWKQKIDLLTSVPGIGEVVAVTLISSLPELGTISHKIESVQENDGLILLISLSANLEVSESELSRLDTENN